MRFDIPALKMKSRLKFLLKVRYFRLKSPLFYNHFFCFKAETKNKDLDINSTCKILIVSTWKSGCDLVGDILSQHPKSFYHYEPLAWYGIKRFKSESDEEAVHILRSLLLCNYGPSIDHYRQDFITNPELLIHNKHLWPHCRKFGWRSWCARDEFLDAMCSLFPIQVMKTARVNLKVISDLLLDSK